MEKVWPARNRLIHLFKVATESWVGQVGRPEWYDTVGAANDKMVHSIAELRGQFPRDGKRRKLGLEGALIA